MGPLDPEFFEGDEIRAALAARDIGTVYRLLGRLGVTQRQIARLTGQSQSDVSEIRQGRRVRDVWVLERIADGLGVPRAWMGLSYREETPDAPSTGKVVDEAMKRRVLVAATSSAVFVGVAGLGELALPTGWSLPSRLDMSHVRTVRTATERWRGVARYYGGQAEVFSAVATIYTQWMQVPAPDDIKAALAAALAELHTEAGWACYDSGVDGTGHFTRALGLADVGGDAYGIANAAWHLGMVLTKTGYPNDALKQFQLGQFQLGAPQLGKSTPATLRPGDPRVPILAGRLAGTSAAAYARMGGHDEAIRCLAEARDGWEPRDAFERADADFVAAVTQRNLGQLDAAEQLAASAASTYGENHRRYRVVTGCLLAEVHVRAGEPRGLTLAHDAIEGVRTLQSVAARQEWLVPLAAALEARPGSDSRDLARAARHIVTTRV
ncbi:MAG: helix-turn-helix domain-containing protein [Pseudonocardiaceae bacterium]